MDNPFMFANFSGKGAGGLYCPEVAEDDAIRPPLGWGPPLNPLVVCCPLKDVCPLNDG